MHVGDVAHIDDRAVDLLDRQVVDLFQRTGLAFSATFQSNLPSFWSPAGNIRFCTVIVLTTSSADTLWACMAS